MSLSEQKKRLAVSIDQHVNKIITDGGSDDELLVFMYDQMPNFKHLMDTCNSDEMYTLYQQYDGFYHFAKLLKNFAEGITDKTIYRPKQIYS